LHLCRPIFIFHQRNKRSKRKDKQLTTTAGDTNINNNRTAAPLIKRSKGTFSFFSLLAGRELVKEEWGKPYQRGKDLK